MTNPYSGENSGVEGPGAKSNNKDPNMNRMSTTRVPAVRTKSPVTSKKPTRMPTTTTTTPCRDCSTRPSVNRGFADEETGDEYDSYADPSRWDREGSWAGTTPGTSTTIRTSRPDTKPTANPDAAVRSVEHEPNSSPKPTPKDHVGGRDDHRKSPPHSPTNHHDFATTVSPNGHEWRPTTVSSVPNREPDHSKRHPQSGDEHLSHHDAATTYEPTRSFKTTASPTSKDPNESNSPAAEDTGYRGTRPPSGITVGPEAHTERPYGDVSNSGVYPTVPPHGEGRLSSNSVPDWNSPGDDYDGLDDDDLPSNGYDNFHASTRPVTTQSPPIGKAGGRTSDPMHGSEPAVDENEGHRNDDDNSRRGTDESHVVDPGGKSKSERGETSTESTRNKVPTTASPKAIPTVAPESASHGEDATTPGRKKPGNVHGESNKEASARSPGDKAEEASDDNKHADHDDSGRGRRTGTKDPVEVAHSPLSPEVVTGSDPKPGKRVSKPASSVPHQAPEDLSVKEDEKDEGGTSESIRDANDDAPGSSAREISATAVDPEDYDDGDAKRGSLIRRAKERVPDAIRNGATNREAKNAPALHQPRRNTITDPSPGNHVAAAADPGESRSNILPSDSNAKHVTAVPGVGSRSHEKESRRDTTPAPRADDGNMGHPVVGPGIAGSSVGDRDHTPDRHDKGREASSLHHHPSSIPAPGDVSKLPDSRNESIRGNRPAAPTTTAAADSIPKHEDEWIKESADEDDQEDAIADGGGSKVLTSSSPGTTGSVGANDEAEDDEGKPSIPKEIILGIPMEDLGSYMYYQREHDADEGREDAGARNPATRSPKPRHRVSWPESDDSHEETTENNVFDDSLQLQANLVNSLWGSLRDQTMAGASAAAHAAAAPAADTDFQPPAQLDSAPKSIHKSVVSQVKNTFGLVEKHLPTRVI